MIDNINQRAIDEESREKIIKNIDDNYFVEAGAGSGKTTSLVNRMLSIIKAGRDISHICAITFTKAAANEFYDRFQRTLINESLKNDIYHDLYINALQNIDLAFMGTIDSFCNMIMSEHPIEGLIPSDAKVMDINKAQALYKKAYVDIQNGLYNDESLEEKALRFIHYNDYPEELFINTLNSLLSHRDSEIIIPEYFKDSIDERYKDSISAIRKVVNLLCNNPSYITSSNEEKANSVRKSFEQYRQVFNRNWDNNIPKILNAYKHTFENDDFRLVYDQNILKELEYTAQYFKEHEGRVKYFELNENGFNNIIQEIKDNQYAITLDFVDSAKEKILTLFRKQGNLTFNDYLVYLRDTLRNDAKNGGKLIKHIYSRHRYFLIDEFQDTDPIQAQIFFYLSAETINEDWKKCIPHKGSLFIVGDPKQSIYRFKNADVKAYLNVEEMFDGSIGEVLHLYQNFRSTPTIKDWFNKTFKETLIKNDEQAPFEEIPNEYTKDDSFTGIYKYDVPFKASDINQKDEYIVKELILKLVHNKDYQISDKNGKRELEYKDFMIITPTKPSLSLYTKVFKENLIPYYVEGNIVFNESKAFEVLVYFYGTIINPKDNRYLYALLRSSLYNISEDELLFLRKQNKHLNINIELDNISNELKKALSQIKEFNQLVNKLSPASLYSLILDRVNIFNNIDNQNMEYLFFVLELLKTKQTNKEIITHNDAINFFETLLYETNDQERCPGFKKDGNQVHLANLHKVKGLEAPVVILAHPRTNKKEPDFRVEREDDNKGYVFSINKKIGDTTIKLLETSIYDDTYKQKEELSNTYEKSRLNYVAATRAKNVLIISNLSTQKGPSSLNPWLELLNTNSSKDILDLNTQLSLVSYNLDKSESINIEDISEVNNILVEQENNLLKTNYELCNPSKLIETVNNETEEINEKIQKHINENGKDNLATITGTMVHRLMELIIISKDSFNKNELINTILNENIKDDFKDKEAYFNNLLSNIYDVMHNGGFIQKGKVTQDILKELLNAQEVYPEVPFTYNDNGNLYNGIIDLIYRKDNKLHIIDWKTNKDDSNLDEHYKNQLDAYLNATRQLLNEDVEDALIYHISLEVNNE